MVAPYEHLNTIAVAKADQLCEMMQLSQRLVAALQLLYRPEGFNVGMNLGTAAGAGIREHFHLHVVPRWNGGPVLPGDISIRRGNFSFYFPIVSCLVISIVLTLLLRLFSK